MRRQARTTDVGQLAKGKEAVGTSDYPGALSLLEAIIGQHLFDRTGRRRDVPSQKKSDSAADDEQEDDDEDFQRDMPSLLITRRR